MEINWRALVVSPKKKTPPTKSTFDVKRPISKAAITCMESRILIHFNLLVLSAHAPRSIGASIVAKSSTEANNPLVVVDKSYVFPIFNKLA